MRKGFLVSSVALLFAGSATFAEDPTPAPLAPALSGASTNASGPSCSSDSASCFAPGADACGPPGRFWASAEYLLWWARDDHVPPLVTASPTASAGVLGAPGTVVLYGGSVDENPFSGGRFALGFWADNCHKFGFETDFLFLGTQSNDFTAAGSGAAGSTTAIARPVINVATGAEASELVASAGALGGTVSVDHQTRLWGLEENVLCNLYCCGCCDSGTRIDFIAGFRYLQMDESLAITENLTVDTSVPTIGGSTIGVYDGFTTHNYFYGGQIGARAEWWRDRFFANVTGKVAFGNTFETIDINGTTTFTPVGGKTTVQSGGLLALPTNIGHYEHDEFTVVPEIDFNVGYQLTRNIRAFVGYSFLYWSNVARPGDQIDRTINVTQIPSTSGPDTLIGPARPAFILNQTDIWAQGINFGIELRY